jgi:hypothetical protein
MFPGTLLHQRYSFSQPWHIAPLCYYLKFTAVLTTAALAWNTLEVLATGANNGN